MADWFRHIQPEGWMANGHIDQLQTELGSDPRADWIEDVEEGKTILGLKDWMFARNDIAAVHQRTG